MLYATLGVLMVFSLYILWVIGGNSRVEVPGFGSLTLALIGVLALLLGLRHAVDADHLVAIDTSVRKLVQGGRSSDLVGLFFSLGHSTVVILVSLAIVLLFREVLNALPIGVGEIISMGLGAAILTVLAIVNAALVIEMVRLARSGHHGEVSAGDLVVRYRPLFKLVTRQWHAYFVGLVFGLSFDTATQVGLLVLVTILGMHGILLYTLILIPLLFTLGMVAVDTTNSIYMTRLYAWALLRDFRGRLLYSITVTSMSALYAAIVAAVYMVNIAALVMGAGEVGVELDPLTWVILPSFPMAFALYWIHTRFLRGR